jgi:DNA-binding transcriptional regulator LsrR (DeoR family)
MPKTRKDTKDIHRQVSSLWDPVHLGKDRDVESSHPSAELSPVARMWAICKSFCAGNKVDAIRKELREELGDTAELKREAVYSYVHVAGSLQMLFVEVQEHAEYREKIYERCGQRIPVHVVRTGSSHQVAQHAARLLLSLVREKTKEKGPDSPVHVGIAAGFSMRHLARAFAQLLCGPVDGLPEEIVFHTLVPGFDGTAPLTDPNTFSVFFDHRDVMRVDVRFLGLKAPAIVKTKGLAAIMKTDMIRRAQEALVDLDIVVMSGAQWSDEHNLYRQGLGAASPATVQELLAAKCVGDVMGGPIGPDGPLNLDTEARALMLLGIDDLRSRIRNGTRVLLMLGPCHACGLPKGDLLGAVLGQNDPFITHLVVDSRTARHFLGEKVRHPGRRAAAHGVPDFDRYEKMAVAAQLLCEGWTFGEMEDVVRERFVSLKGANRTELYRLVNRAARDRLIHFRPPYHLDYEHRIGSAHKALHRVTVVRTAALKDVTQLGAKTLLGLVQQRTGELASEGESVKRVVHIGFAAGVAMRELAAAFADLLRQPFDFLPDKIVCHSLVAGFDPGDPSTDPNAFFTVLWEDSGLQVEIEPVWLPVPAPIGDEQLEFFWRQNAIQQAREATRQIDIVVTSGADWRDEHSLFFRLLEAWSHDCARQLREQGCVGDILCQPLAMQGPLEGRTGLQALSLLELPELPAMIGRGMKVLLVLGPCAACNRPKGALLDAVLSQKESLITHLIVDSRTAAEFVSRRANGAREAQPGSESQPVQDERAVGSAVSAP